MYYKKFSGNDISIFGAGLMRWDYKQSDVKDKLSEFINFALDNGINYFDTAYIYGDNNSEKIIGSAINKNMRDKMFIATKLPVWLCKSRDDFFNILETQLKNFNTDHIDYYLFHALNKYTFNDVINNNLYDYMLEAKKQGKISNIGFSFHDRNEVFKNIVDTYKFDFCLVQHNYMDIDFQAGLSGIRYAKSKNIDIAIMEPLHGGYLVNNLPKNITDIFEQNNNEPIKLGFNYIWNIEEVSLLLSGLTTIDQLKYNLNIINNKYMFTNKDYELCTNIKKEFEKMKKVKCTDCGYCLTMKCGVNIPYNFTLYNNYNMYDEKNNSKFSYNCLMEKQDKASSCKKCGRCLKICPQQINIINELVNVDNTLKE